MRSKTAQKAKRVNCNFKCSACGSSFGTMQALTWHGKSVHSTAKKNDSPVINRVGILSKTTNPVSEKPEAKIMPTVNKNVLKVTSDNVNKKTQVTSDNVNKKTQFVCPKCGKAFQNYFSAVQHLQKYCVYRNDDMNNTNSDNAIKPIEREQCILCKEMIDPQTSHNCDSTTKTPVANLYKCFGCDRCYSKTSLFNLHLPGRHNDGVICMFYKNEMDVIKWIAKIEIATEAKYKRMSFHNEKQIYLCSYVQADDADKKCFQMCPSSFQVQTYPKGYQVNFYPKHHGHKCKTYTIDKEDRKHCITSYFHKYEEYDEIVDSISDPEDQYVQFKNVMEKITLEAAKLDAVNLNMIMGKALEMSQMLNNYDDHEKEEKLSNALNVTVNDKSLTDDQITDVLQEVRQKNKRKVSFSPNASEEFDLEEDPLLIKRTKTKRASKNVVELEPKIVDTFSLSNLVSPIKNDEQKPDLVDKNVVPPPKTKYPSDSQSFNDSYKEFIGTLPQAAKTLVKKRLYPNKKNIVKTKIGQFDPNSPRRLASKLNESNSSPETAQPPVRKTSKSTDSNKSLDRKKDEESVPADISHKKSKIKKKDSTNTVKNQKKTQIKTIPKDVEYEVMEQENDCNILVLKF